MPFANRIVGKADPAINEVRPDECTEAPGLNPEDEVNKRNIKARVDNTLADGSRNFFLELASLVRHSEDLFNELFLECNRVFQRVKKVKKRITSLTDVVVRLNAREVSVPESDLSIASQQTEHHRSSYGYDCQLFTPATRPSCIQLLYKSSEINPVHVIRQCNLYRIDGKTGSSIFSLLPTLTSSGSNSSLENFQSVKTPFAWRSVKPLREPKCTRRVESLVKESGQCRLPQTSDRIRQLSRSQPVLIVPVDVSGQTYRQLTEQRSRSNWSGSLYDMDVKGKRSLWKRGRFSSAECVKYPFGFGLRACDDLWKRSPSKERWERARCLLQESRSRLKTDKLKPKLVKERSKSKKEEESNFCSWRKSLCSLFKTSKDELDDLWIKGQPDSIQNTCFEEALPLTRSQSLPRTFRTSVQNSPRRVISSESLSSDKTFEIVPEICESSIPRMSVPRLRRQGRQMTRSTPKTLEFGSPEGNSTGFCTSEASSSSTWKAVAGSSSHVLETNMTSGGCREVFVHIPEQPWTRPFAKVKLRPQSTKVELNGCQTSSGNWSADSACHSMHSDQMSVMPPGDRQARNSLDKDSAISDINNCDRLSVDNGHTRSSLAVAESSVEHAIHSNSDCSSVLSSSGLLLEKSACALSHDNLADERWAVDDDSSLFSVDQDGFYTSMHADSGLSKTGPLTKSSYTLTPGDNFGDGSISSWKKEQSEVGGSTGTVVFHDWLPVTSVEEKRFVLTKSEEKLKEMLKNDAVFIPAEPSGLVCAASTDLPPGGNILAKPPKEQSRTEAKTGSYFCPSFCAVLSGSKDADDVIDPLAQSTGVLLNTPSACKIPSQEVDAATAKDETFVVSRTTTCNQKPLDIGTLQGPDDDVAQKETKFSSFSTWPRVHLTEPCNNVKSILKSKKKKSVANIEMKSIIFGPTTCLNDDLCLKKLPLDAEGEDNHEVANSMVSYGESAFHGSSFLGEDILVEKQKQKKGSSKKSKTVLVCENADCAANSNDVANSGIDLPTKYAPRIFVTAKKRRNGFIADTTRTPAQSSVTTGYGYLGSDTITTCTGTEAGVHLPLLDLAPVSAKLVITSPVTERTKYVDNPYKRLLCTSITRNDLQQFSNYNDPGQWYNTLPRKPSMRKKPMQRGNTCDLGYPGSGLLDPDGSHARNMCSTKTLDSGLRRNTVSHRALTWGDTFASQPDSSSSGTIRRVCRPNNKLSASTVAETDKSCTNQTTTKNPTNKVTAVLYADNAPLLQCSLPSPRSAESLLNHSLPSFRQDLTTSGASCVEDGIWKSDAMTNISQGTFGNAKEIPDDAFISRGTTAFWEPGSITSSLPQHYLRPNTLHSNASPTDLDKKICFSCGDNEAAIIHKTTPCLTPVARQQQQNSSLCGTQQNSFKSFSLSNVDISEDLPHETAELAENGFEFSEKKKIESRNVISQVVSMSSVDDSPDLVPLRSHQNPNLASMTSAKSQESISSILSAAECHRAAKLSFSCDQIDDTSESVRQKTCEPFARRSLCKVSSKPTIQKSREKERQGETFNKDNSYLSDTGTSRQQKCAITADIETHGVLSSSMNQSQKQSFESDSSGIGGSVFGSPMTSPDTEVSINSSLPPSAVSALKNHSSATKCLLDMGHSNSPDVIPLIARNQLGFGFGEKDSAEFTGTNSRSKQTSV